MKGPDLDGWPRGVAQSAEVPPSAGSRRRARPPRRTGPTPVTIAVRRAATETARVAFVGAGPGDPGLMTVRSRELLALADVVVVDQVDEDFVRHFMRRNALIVDTANEPNGHGGAAAGFPDILVSTVHSLPAGGLVVRLIAGDPGLFRGFAEEALALRKAGVSFDVVPGVSPLTAASTYAGVPLISGCATSVQVVDAGREPRHWVHALDETVTLVVVGAPLTIAETLAELVTAGSDPDTQVAVIAGGVTMTQSSTVTTLARAPRLLAAGGTSGPLIVVVGHTVGLQEALSWFETKPLFGWDVLLPLTKDPARAAVERLAAYGARATPVPTIGVEPPRNPHQMERAVKDLVTGRYEWVAFTSAHAVRAVREKVEAFGLDARCFAGLRVAAVGGKTARALGDWGIAADLVPTGESVVGLLELWPEYDKDIDPMKSVLVPRADIATDALVAGLADLGWDVEDVMAFRTVRAAPPPAPIREAIKGGAFDAVLFTSSSTVRNLVGIAGKPHPQTVVACIGPQTAKTAQEYGLRVDVIASVPSSEALVDALAAHGTTLSLAARQAGVPARRPSEHRQGRRRAR